METYEIRIYPHEYMDRAKQDHFAAFNIADKISNVIKLMLDSDTEVKYIDESTNDSYQYLILNPNSLVTKELRKKIELVFPKVHFGNRWREVA
jgi:hypothetical protein|tara:strand:+ start:147 stop:425 length:279 start_codon:yes stop_codon:yes gene_type:complete